MQRKRSNRKSPRTGHIVFSGDPAPKRPKQDFRAVAVVEMYQQVCFRDPTPNELRTTLAIVTGKDERRARDDGDEEAA